MYTLSPADRNSRTKDLPMPRVPPVMTTFRGCLGDTQTLTVAARCASAKDAPSKNPTAPESSGRYDEPAAATFLYTNYL